MAHLEDLQRAFDALAETAPERLREPVTERGSGVDPQPVAGQGRWSRKFKRLRLFR